MNKKILFPVATLVVLWFFLFGIPLDMYDSNSTLFTIVGAFAISGLLGASLLNWLPTPEPDLNTEISGEKKTDNSGCVVIAIVVAFFFGFSFYQIWHVIELKNDELKNHGEFTTGMIVDGSSIKTRKADFTSVTIKFRLKDGKPYTANADMSASEFENYYQNQEVPIVYSTNYPSIIEILKTPEQVEKYSKIKSRTLTLADLIHVLEIGSADKINEYLNTVSQKWDYQNGEDVKTVVFFNNVKDIGIKMNGTKEVTYLHSTIDPELFDDEISKNGFKLSSETSGIGGKDKMYSNGKYLLVRRNERLKSNDSDQGLLDVKLLTIVSIMKIEE